MVRESSSQELKEAYWKKYPDLNPDFIFAFPAYNVRNTEIGAIIGRSQLTRLDENNRLRTRNQQIFWRILIPQKYRTDFRVEGSSNYAFNLVLQRRDIEFTDRLMQRMREEKTEFRRGSAGGGNQLRQPYLRERLGDLYRNFPMRSYSLSWFLHWQFPEFRATDGSGTLQDPQLGGMMSEIWKTCSL